MSSFNHVCSTPASRDHNQEKWTTARAAFRRLLFSLKTQSALWLVCLLVLLMGTGPAPATTYYWNKTGANTYGTSGNWSPSGAPGASDTAVFNNSTINSNVQVKIGSAKSIAAVQFVNTGTTSITTNTASTQTWTIGAGGITIDSNAGAVTISQGGLPLTLSVSGNQTWTNNSPNTMTDGSGVAIAVTATSSSTLTLNGNFTFLAPIVNGAGLALLQSGGLVTMQGANTYTGTTTIDGGTLYINGNQTSASGAVTVANNATLSGTGIIGGATTIQSGGIYSPGTTSPGSLTQAAGLSINSGGIFNWENNAGNTLGSAGTNWGVANLTGGGLTIDSTASTGSKLKLSFNSGTDFTNSFWDANQSWNFITGGVSSAFDASNISIFINGVPQNGGSNTITSQGTFTTIVSGGNEELVWTALVGGIPTAFWSGASGDWGTTTNWNTTATSGEAVGVLPNSGTDVHFSTTAPPPGNLGAVDLAANFAVKTLSFDAGAAAVTIGSANSSTLTIIPTLSTNGIDVDTSAGDNTLNVKVALGADQTWTVGANRTLSATDQISGGFSLTKAGAGILTLSGNNSFSGQLIVQSGTLSVATMNDLNTAGPMGMSGSNAVRTQLGANGQTGTLQYTGATATCNRIWNIGGTGAVIDVTNATTNLTFDGSSNLNGSGNLTKTGPGTLTLKYGSSGYTNGAIILSEGTLAANGNNQVFGAALVTLTLNGGTTLDLNDTVARSFEKNTTVNGSMTIIAEKSTAGSGVDYTMGTLGIGASTLTVSGGNVTSSTAGLTFGATTLSGAATFNITNPVAGGTTLLTIGALTNAGFTPTLTGNGNFAQTGAASGNGGFTLDATYSGLATLNQANGYIGGTTIGGGTLNFSGFSAEPSSGPLAIGGGATVNLFNLGVNSTSPTVNVTGAGTFNVHLTGGLYIDNEFTYDMSGFSGILDIQGSGRLTMQSSFVSPAAGATIKVENGTTAYLGYFGTTTLLCTVQLNGTTDDGENLGQLRVENGNHQAGSVILNANSTIGSDGGIGYIDGVISDGGAGKGFTKQGSGTLMLTNANTYSGPTTIVNGTLNANSTAALGDSSATNTLILNGGTLQAGGTITSVATRGVILSADSTIDTGIFDVSIAGSIGGTYALTKKGSGTLILSGSNSYSGPTNVNGGVLRADALGALATNSDATISGGTLDTGNFIQTVKSLTMNGGDSDALNLYVGSILTVTGSAIFDGTLNLSNTASLIGGKNTLMYYSGYAGGFATTSSLPTGYTLSYATAGELDILVATSVDGVWSASSGGGSAQWSDSSNWTPAAVPKAIGDSATIGTGTQATIDLAGSKPTLSVLTFNNSGSPHYQILDSTGTGSLTLQGTGSSSASVTVTTGSDSIGANLVLASEVVFSGSGTLALSGSISGTGPLTMSGTNGTLILSGTGLYTGGTIVNAGILAVTTSTALPDGYSLTVGAGGTLIFDPSYSGSSIIATPISSFVASPVSPVPEPSTLALLAAGLVVGFGVWRRRK